MGLLSLLFRNPAAFILLAGSLLYSVIAHEVAHGFVAHLFGDDTARLSGRLSANPAKHLDPAGTLALFLVGFGWARPVPVDYSRFRNFRLGLISVSLAGCLANIAIATIAIFLLRFNSIMSNSLLASLLLVVARINIMLGAFNLIPIPPLDGSKVLMAFLPAEAQNSFARIEPYGFFILIFLIITGFLNPVIVMVQRLIFLIIGTVL